MAWLLISLPEHLVKALRELVRKNLYSSVDEAIRVAVERLIREEVRE